MASPTTPYPFYPNGIDPEYVLNSLQHHGIIHSINSATKDTTREVSAIDRHLSDGFTNVSTNMAQSTAKIVDTIGSQSLGLRDAVERNSLNISNGINAASQNSANSFRDMQVSVERSGLTGTNTRTNTQ